ncbi:hypothetical protein N499_0020A, partial [Wolbachia pipientis wVitA]
MSSIAKF